MKLNRVLLINWLYYTKEVLDFDQINLLSGKTGHGKSAFIDAMQIVILGETRDSNFNKSSGNTKTDRKLIDYLKGRNDEGAFKRKGVFSSHICLEFINEKQEKFCYGIVFDCDSTINEKSYRYYFLQHEIPNNEFISEDKVMSIDATTRYIKMLGRNNQLDKSRVFLTNREYKNNFSTRLGIRSDKFYEIFKKAVSYKPLENIPEFIVKYICSETKEINLEELSESMENYKNLVHELEVANKKRILLDDIYNFSEDYKVKKETLNNELIKIEVLKYYDYHNKLNVNRIEYENAQKELQEIANEITLKKAEKSKKADQYNLLCSTLSPTENLKARINEFKTEIHREQGTIEKNKLIYKNLVIKVKNDIDNILDDLFDQELEKKFNTVDLGVLSHELQKLKNGIEAEGVTFDVNVFENLELFQVALNSYKAETSILKKALSKELNDLNAEIQQLELGQKAYPSQLLNLRKSIQLEMNRIYQKNVSVDIFADQIDISDSTWKNAIEAYLYKQKMNLIVDPEYFIDCYKIFKSICKSRNIYGYSLVDVDRIRLKDKSDKVTLYNKISTKDKRSDKYAKYLLDRVVCCNEDKHIRDHFTSMMSDGTLYTSYAVSQLSSELWRKPFIGTDSIEIQLKEAYTKRKDLKEQLKTCNEKLSILEIEFLGRLLNTKHEIQEYFNTLKNIEINKNSLLKLQESLSLNDIEILMQQDKEKQSLQEEIDKYDKEIEKLNEKSGGIKERLGGIFTKIDKYSKSVEDQEQVLTEKNIDKEHYDFDSTADYKQLIQNSEQLQLKCKETIRMNTDRVFMLKSQYNDQFHMSIDTTIENEDYLKEMSRYSNEKISEYVKKVNIAHEEAKECFENQFFATLKRKIDNVTRELRDINRTIKLQRFGDSQYRFVATPNNDYKDYYDIIMSEDLNGRNLMNSQVYLENKAIIDQLFDKVAQLNQMAQKEYETRGKDIEKYTQFTTYLDFDILDNENSLTKTISSKSGGETQTPFYIAILASLLNLYDTSKDSLRLVIFDEAFDKMDSERIEKSIKLLKNSGFQAIIVTPTDKIPHIAPLADDTYVATTEIMNGFKSSSLNRWRKGMRLEHDD